MNPSIRREGGQEILASANTMDAFSIIVSVLGTVMATLRCNKRFFGFTNGVKQYPQ